MSEVLFEQVAIIGLGQMGASLGLALRHGGLVGQLHGYDLHPDHSTTAFSIGAIDRLATSAADVVAEADLVILCTPVGTYRAVAESIAPHLKAGCVITDIGSIKAQAIRDITAALPTGVRYIPSHPIAGSEQTGPYHAHAHFFERHLFLITPIDGTPPESVEPIAKLWHSTGAQVDLLPPDLHDRIYAYMSHLPQLLAFAAMPVLDEHHIKLREDDALFRRFIRIGRSDPEMWRDVFLENGENVLAAAAHLEAIVTHMRDELLLGGGGAPKSTMPPLPDESLLKAIWPRMLSSALIVSVELIETQLEMKLARYAAGGFTDVSCPVVESVEADFEAVSEHARVMVRYLDAYLQRHQAICAAISAADADALMQQLALCQASGKKLLTPLH